MKTFAKCLVTTVGLACSWLAVSSAKEAALAAPATPRAYVSVTGNDANTCNVPTAPCRTYTGAISQVTPGGTVIVMDSGTFGGGTISQSVTINAPLGVVALAATSIVVNPGTGNTVVLRGLTFQAAVPGTGTGITHQSGTLFVENTVVNGWYHGLESQSGAQKLFVKGSAFRNNAQDGLSVQTGSTANVTIDQSFFENNGNAGINFLGGKGRVSNTVMTASYVGGNVQGAGTEVTFRQCEVSSNTVGLGAYSSGVLGLSQTTVTRNFTGLEKFSPATMETFGNNIVHGNTLDVAGGGTITTVPLY